MKGLERGLNPSGMGLACGSVATFVHQFGRGGVQEGMCPPGLPTAPSWALSGDPNPCCVPSPG